ncbi:hypothetical protein PoB_003815800 [Plakobranchus ocellatus]|uniref:DUF4817 domain-containing protein n=1 Tax=Plakobranchus ocellatus TaxID=259542 RepID=A0AAV4AYS3_9GAST|nr:hypothetical protein PoB_003815800 [Plakobranchus ocellatus]
MHLDTFNVLRIALPTIRIQQTRERFRRGYVSEKGIRENKDSTLASVSRENGVRETTSTCARKFPSPTKQKIFRSRLLVGADGRATQRRRASTSLMLRSLSTVPHKYHGFSKRENFYKMVSSVQTREPQTETATSHYVFLLLSPSPSLTPVPAAVESRPSPG